MQEIKANSPPKTTFFASYLDLAWQTDPDEGLRVWVEAFQQAIDAWQESECQRLLQEIKQAPFTQEIEQVVRYAEGRLAEQQGELKQAIHHYRESLALAHAAGHPLHEAQIRVELGRLCNNLGQLPEAVDHL
jgi:tetratricopeptide (TPR) repeat protein